MDLSILVAKIVSLSYLAVAIGALSGVVDFRKMVDEYQKSAAMPFLAGVYTFAVGAILINYHNTWNGDWTVLVTIIAWLTAIKGFVLMAFPKYLMIGKALYSKPKAMGVVILVLAAVFGYFGFYAA